MEESKEFDIMYGLKTVIGQIKQAVARRSQDLPQIYPRLVCVSKTKPVPMVIEAYEAGQRHFGENYANELHEKANNTEILAKCEDIKWHYIGHLQTNKINKVLGSPGIYIVETVHCTKLADNLNKQWPKYSKDGEQLNVMIQINTSGEDVKSGVEPSEVLDLVKHIRDNCKNLNLRGLMTIGQYGYDYSKGPNPDFISLSNCRDSISKSLQLELKDLELSMGMSSDFAHAIEAGSTNVRVGTNIFGVRPPKAQ